MSEALITTIIILSIPIICIAADIFTRHFLKSCCGEKMYCVLPIAKDTVDIEMRLISMRGALNRCAYRNFTVFITDFGADSQTRLICEKFCENNESFTIIEPDSLALLIFPHTTS